jgi:hypothetical protein
MFGFIKLLPLKYLQDDISSDHKDRERYLYTQSIQQINSYEFVPGTTIT